jgi:hypothetical protein
MCTLILTSTCKAEENYLKFSGSTNYSRDRDESFITSMEAKYKYTFYEPTHGKWSLHISGKVSPDYNHFNYQIKTNVFTVLGIDF